MYINNQNIRHKNIIFHFFIILIFIFIQLKVGLITISGNILGTIDGLAITTKLVIDYDKTCDVNLKYVEITKLGKINLKMTGLGSLNCSTSKILTWLIRIWEHKIVKAVEVNVKNIIEEQLSEFICKK